jgi:hypothetical protein
MVPLDFVMFDTAKLKGSNTQAKLQSYSMHTLVSQSGNTTLCCLARKYRVSNSGKTWSARKKETSPSNAKQVDPMRRGI